MESKIKKEQKEYKFKSLIEKHIKFIPNSFFFWKRMLQEYSTEKSMCVFITTNLLPEKLKNKLINCIKNIIKLEIDKLNIYIDEIKRTINENKLLPEYIKNQTIKTSIYLINEDIQELYKYVGKEKEKFNVDDLYNLVHDNLLDIYDDLKIDTPINHDKFRKEWDLIEPTIEKLMKQKDFYSRYKFGPIYQEFIQQMNSDIEGEYLANEYDKLEIKIKKEMEIKDIGKITVDNIKDIFKNAWLDIKTLDEINTSFKGLDFKSGLDELLNYDDYSSIHNLYDNFSNKLYYDEADGEDDVIIDDKWVNIVKPEIEKLINLSIEGKSIKPVNNSKLCDFIKLSVKIILNIYKEKLLNLLNMN